MIFARAIVLRDLRGGARLCHATTSHQETSVDRAPSTLNHLSYQNRWGMKFGLPRDAKAHTKAAQATGTTWPFLRSISLAFLGASAAVEELLLVSQSRLIVLQAEH